MSSLESSMSPLIKEKQDNVYRSDVRTPPRHPSWGWGRLGVVLLAVVSGVGVISHFGHGRINYGFHFPSSGYQTPSSSETPEPSDAPEGWTEWSDITPSEKLIWQPCFQIYGPDFQCARLTVPMDYHRPLNESADHPKVHLALVLKPGINRTEDPSSFGESPLLVNPGGPGGSGAGFALSASGLLQTAVGRDRDVIGFDPRGVGATTPKADCFVAPDDPFGLDGRNVAYMQRLGWLTSGHDVGIVNSSNVALSKLNARSKALSKLCKRVDDVYGNDSIFRYSNTPNVARDMLSIVHAWDEWRSVPDVKPAKSNQKLEPTDGQQTVTKIEAQDSTQGKLVYWGFSYGTLLGATFASMFPDKVGRIILDGVVDADHYVSPMLDNAIFDTDAIWDKFFSYCADAGSRCPFYQSGDKPGDIKSRVDGTMNWLEKEPAIVLPYQANVPLLITASDVKMIIFSGLYSPIASFPAIATLLRAIVDGNLDSFVTSPAPTVLCHNLTLPQWPDDAQKVIGCSDKRYKLNDDLDSLQARFEAMANFSSFADVWMNVGFNLGCNGWDIESKDPPMRWDDHPAHKQEPIETSFPLLFLSNHFDPVTPLRSALKMTRKFSQASIIEQIAEGHCTVSCISFCTIGHIQAYFNKGILPPAPKFDSDDEGQWTTCSCNEKPWKSLNDRMGVPQSNGGALLEKVEGEADILDGMTAEEASLMTAYGGLRNKFAEFTAAQHQSEYRNPIQLPWMISSSFMDNEHHTCSKP
ncbi:alpha/beta-hydrolase [Annulohypoxylon truncatum]|uniref:alpha/beta-hydrolase n=1 Tax=Annulohypoxylon truncatum TaxID=327061 RepID=UPI00200721CC|nr:alpha/beta-hydrolase [Annulohypoxylon truncatum]KAI1214614.1 alpha/beta-hydrolase [Annulohypoxylon truncatum]